MDKRRPSFNLVDEPWIRARTMSGSSVELSLIELFSRAGDLKVLSNDVPTQDFAILRLLIAVLQRSVIDECDSYEYPSDAWGELWVEHRIPLELVEEYLHEWHDRFDLFDNERPFMQVADMRATNGSVSEVKKLLVDVPDGLALFRLKSGEGLESLSFAEAARWLVHCQAFDTSGIKTGVVGDSSVKGGKSYPIGTGWSGRLGGLYLEGSNLTETLLLNLVLCDDCYDNMDTTVSEFDRPAWEQPQKLPGDEDRFPNGAADLYTWQTRRVRLLPQDGRVVGVILTNGSKVESLNKNHLEPMTSWRRSRNQERSKKIPVAFLPVTHQSGRAIWRGLSTLLSTRDSEEARSPGVVLWAGHLASMDGGEHLSERYPICIHATGLEYGVQSSVVTELIDDQMYVSAFLMSEQGESIAYLAKECMQQTDEAVWALGVLAVRLKLACGDDPEQVDGVRDVAKSEAYFELDSPFRTWLSSLGPDTDAFEARERWYSRARSILWAIAHRLVEEAGPDAIMGRKITTSRSEEWVSSSRVERWFGYRLGKSMPLADNQDDEKKGEE